MSRFIAVLAMVSCALSGAARADDVAVEVPVQKVVLYSSGVGYFEHGGSVTGDATAELRFKTEQINDMLKSLVLQDLGGGQVGTVVYPSQDPLAKTLKSFEVDISGNPSLGDLLNQLRGAYVTVTALGQDVTGMILGLEQREKPVDDGAPVTVTVLNLVTDAGLKAFELPLVSMIHLEDQQLQQELNRALVALAQARGQDKKPVTIEFNGQGERRVRIGYVVETPIWKTTYRLILSESESEAANLQGWAIVENQTESDWDNVQLALVSGRPISFIQNLYEPLYIDRPVVQPELYASLRPQSYEDGVMQDAENAERFAGRSVRRRGAKMAPEAPAEMLRSARVGGGMAGDDFFDAALDATASVASMAAADDVGELFQYAVPNVSLPRQRSAMIPIITDEVAVQRLSIYNRQVMARHPLTGARLKNTTGNHLMQGPVTVLDEGAYAGDARIDDLPDGQERLLSYGVDLNVRVDAANTKETTALQTGRIVKGVLYLQRKQLFQQKYIVENNAENAKTVIIEHPFRQGWKLVDTPEPIEQTEQLYRFQDTVAAGKTATLEVNEEFIRSETIALLSTDLGPLQHYSRVGEIPADVRKAIAEAVRLKSAMVDTERAIDERERRIQSVTAEQERIRENMATVDKSSQYYTRLLTKLNDQETQIEQWQSDLEKLRAKYQEQRNALESYLQDLNVG